ncbi:MAG: hypothetical protein Q9222_001581 [Ikaeria aurantiellina]
MSSISNLTTTDGSNWETSDNHSPLVNVLTWFLVITTFFAVAARVATRFAVVRQLRWDDTTILIAMVLSIAHSATTSLQANNGLGRHEGSISPDHATHFEKATYASGFLYIGVISAVKLSICLHLDNLTPVRLHRNMIRVLALITGLWMISSMFVLGFQCHLPSPWQINGNQCIGVTSFWASYHIINIITDIGLIVLPWVILLGLQVEVKRKAVIIGCFSARILVVVVTVVQIYYLFSRTVGTEDLMFDLWLVALLGEVVIALSIITACIPYLKPFMEALETGMIAAGGGVVTSSQQQSPSAYGYYKHGSSSDYRKYGNVSKKGSRAQLDGDPGVRMDNFGYAATAAGTERDYDRRDQQTAHTIIESKGHRGGRDSDTESQGSQSRIIRKTVGWSVTEEPHSPT